MDSITFRHSIRHGNDAGFCGRGQTDHCGGRISVTVAGCMTSDGDNNSLVAEVAGLPYEVEDRRSSSNRSENTGHVWCFGYGRHLGRAFGYLRSITDNNDCHRSAPLHTACTVAGGGYT